MAGRSSLRRVLMVTGLVAVIGGIGFCAELVRRDYYVQQLNSLRALMLEVDRTRSDPQLLDKRWDRLKARLHGSMAADPSGELAILAYRVGAPLKAEVARVAREDGPIEFVVRYGDAALAGYLLPKEQVFHWEAEVMASWDSAPWESIGQGRWDGEKTSLVRVNLREVFPRGSFHAGSHVLRLKALAHLYVPRDGSEPVEVYTEALDLGMFLIRVGLPKPTAAEP